MNRITEAKSSTTDGEGQPAHALLPMVYEELRKLADAQMAGQPNLHTLQSTALVHEAWLKMVGEDSPSWENRSHFLATAATAMRTILIDHARKKARKKRGGGNWKRIDLDEIELAAPAQEEIILAVDEALHRLENVNPKWAKVVVMKFFGGMSNREVAQALDIGTSSVDRYWAGSKAWLINELQAIQAQDAQ